MRPSFTSRQARPANKKAKPRSGCCTNQGACSQVCIRIEGPVGRRNQSSRLKGRWSRRTYAKQKTAERSQAFSVSTSSKREQMQPKRSIRVASLRISLSAAIPNVRLHSSRSSGVVRHCGLAHSGGARQQIPSIVDVDTSSVSSSAEASCRGRRCQPLSRAFSSRRGGMVRPVPGSK